MDIARLPVFSTVFGAYGAIGKNLGPLLSATVFPILGLVVLGVIESTFDDSVLVTALFWLLSLPLAALIAVACHRVVLLGPESLDSQLSFSWSERETSFVVWLIILAVMGLLLFWGLTAIFLMSPETVFGYSTPWLGMALTYICLTYIQCRFCMVLPATAIDKPVIMSNSWYLTAGNGIRVAIATVLPMAVVFLLFFATSKLALDLPFLVYVVPFIALVLFTTYVEIAVVSLAYRFLTNAARERE